MRSYGTGAFCAGAAFDELAAIAMPRRGKNSFMGFARVILAMTCVRDTDRDAGAWQESSAAESWEIVAAALDYAIATEKAALRLSELAVGIGPFVVGPVIEHKNGGGSVRGDGARRGLA